MAQSLEARNLTKRYSGLAVVDRVDFVLKAGEVTGYLGPNGSGKSTTVKMITGLIEPSDGQVLYGGESISNDIVGYKRLLGYVPEEPFLYLHLSGAEYLEMVGQLRGIPQKKLEEKIEAFLRLFDLYSDRFSPLSAYSKGMKQKVLIAAALLHDPQIVILDEPFSGLDVNSVLVLKHLVQALGEAGKVVLYSSHVLEVVEKVCARVVILNHGRVVANESVSGLRSLMHLPNLEAIFSQMVIEQDTSQIAASMLDVMRM